MWKDGRLGMSQEVRSSGDEVWQVGTDLQCGQECNKDWSNSLEKVL